MGRQSKAKVKKRKSEHPGAATTMLMKLAYEYVKDRNAYQAALRAGYSESVAKKKSGAMVKQLAGTIERLQEKKNQAMMMRGVMSQDEVLQGMSNIGRVNALDYVVIVPIGEGKNARHVAKLKPISELTREQADAITEIREVGGEVLYALPGITDKMAARAFIGKHWGLTDPKLINMRVTQNFNLNADLKDVDSDKLEALENQMFELLGPAISRRLIGYKPGEEEEEPIEPEVIDDDDDD
jgi:hypothetical protein